MAEYKRKPLEKKVEAVKPVAPAKPKRVKKSPVPKEEAVTYESMVALNKEVGKCFNHTDRQFDPKFHQGTGDSKHQIFFVFTQDNYPGFRVRGFTTDGGGKGHTLRYGTRVYESKRQAHAAAQLLAEASPKTLAELSNYWSDASAQYAENRHVRLLASKLSKQL